MPQFNNNEEWEAWRDGHRVYRPGGHKSRRTWEYDPYVSGDPESFPCFMFYEYISGNCGPDGYSCTFIYPKLILDQGIIWDLEEFEKEWY